MRKDFTGDFRHHSNCADSRETQVLPIKYGEIAISDSEVTR